MTRRNIVLQLLKTYKEMSCNNLCIRIIEEFTHDGRRSYGRDLTNMNASLSGVLNKMVKRGEIELSPNKGPKGGKVYKLKIV